MYAPYMSDTKITKEGAMIDRRLSVFPPQCRTWDPRAVPIEGHIDQGQHSITTDTQAGREKGRAVGVEVTLLSTYLNQYDHGVEKGAVASVLEVVPYATPHWGEA